MSGEVILSCADCGRTGSGGAALQATGPCPSCGGALTAPGEAPAPSRAARSPGGTRGPGRRVPQTSDTRQLANRALATAKQNLLMIRLALITPAVLCGVLFVLVLLVFKGPLDWAVWLMGSVAVTAAVAAVFVLRQPLLCTLLNALLATPLGVMAVLGLLTGTVSLPGLLTVMLAVTFWMAVGMAASTQRLMRRFPDLYAARALRGESTGRHADAARLEARRRFKRTLWIGAALVLVLVGLPLLWVTLGGWGGSATPPEPLAPPGLPFSSAETAWREAWNADQLPAVKALLAESEKARKEPFLDRMIKKRSWTPLPRLEPADVEESGEHRRIARYALDGFDADLVLYWEWERTRWVVVNLSFPSR